MFLRSQLRQQDGQEHTCWSVVENQRLHDGRGVQRQVLYLGEVNDAQRAAWRKTRAAHTTGSDATAQIALFPHDRPAPTDDERGVRIRLDQLSLQHPRQWGGGWLALELYRQLGLDTFFAEHLPASRKGTRWDQIRQVLVTQRLLAPGSEWQRHRDWFERTALADLLGGDFGLAEIHRLYATLDQGLPLKEKLFDHLRDPWRDRFGAKYEVLLYDLTSTYFETGTPEDPADPRRHGYSRDHRPDCPQVVIALVGTPEGFPLAYEILPGNTTDNPTLASFLAKIAARYGKAQRVWLMDRGSPTEAVLTQMRASDPPVNYLVGTPKGALTALEKERLARPWETVRAGVPVKLLPQDGEVYVLARSDAWTRNAPSAAKNCAACSRAGTNCGANAPRGTNCSWRWARRRKRPEDFMRCGTPPCLRWPKPCARKHFSFGSTARDCAWCAGAKADICCAATSPAERPPSCGPATGNWCKWKKPSRT